MRHKSDKPVPIKKNGYSDRVIMGMEIYENAMYRDIELSERQIENGQIKDARTALSDMRKKYRVG